MATNMALDLYDRLRNNDRASKACMGRGVTAFNVPGRVFFANQYVRKYRMPDGSVFMVYKNTKDGCQWHIATELTFCGIGSIG